MKSKRGRPAIGEQRIVSITLPENIWEEIDKLATERNKKTSALFRDIVMYYLVYSIWGGK